MLNKLVGAKTFSPRDFLIERSKMRQMENGVKDNCREYAEDCQYIGMTFYESLIQMMCSKFQATKLFLTLLANLNTIFYNQVKS